MMFPSSSKQIVFVSGLILTSLQFACASKSAGSKDGGGAANTAPQPSPVVQQTVVKDLCSDAVLGNMKITLNGSDSLLCKTAPSVAGEVNLIFITAPSCESCKPILKDANQYYASQGRGKMLVAVPQQTTKYVEDFPLRDLNQMIATYSPNASLARDPTGNMWLGLVRNKAVPVFPLLLGLGAQGKYVVIQSEDLSGPSAFANVAQAKLESLK